MTFPFPKKLAASAVLCWIAITLAGCASGPLGTPPDPGHPDLASTLVVIRTKSLVGAPVSFAVTVDGKEVFALRSGDYTRIPVKSGTHAVGVKCMSAIPGTYQEQRVHLTCEDKATYYFLTSPAKGSPAYCAAIKQIEEAEALELISQSK
jgi:hypothetical protein